MFADISLIGLTLSTIWAVILLFVWIAIAFWPARVAARKGYSFLLIFIISIPFWWITLFVVYFVLPNKNAKSTPAKE